MSNSPARQNESEPSSSIPAALSVSQQTAIRELTAGASITDAANSAGVTRQTISRWIHQDPRFQAAYNAWQREMIDSARAQALAMTGKALATIDAAIEKGHVNAALAVARHTGVLDRARPGPTDPNLIARRSQVGRAVKKAELDQIEAGLPRSMRDMVTAEELRDLRHIQYLYSLSAREYLERKRDAGVLWNDVNQMLFRLRELNVEEYRSVVKNHTDKPGQLPPPEHPGASDAEQAALIFFPGVQTVQQADQAMIQLDFLRAMLVMRLEREWRFWEQVRDDPKKRVDDNGRPLGPPDEPRPQSDELREAAEVYGAQLDWTADQVRWYLDAVERARPPAPESTAEATPAQKQLEAPKG